MVGKVGKIYKIDLFLLRNKIVLFYSFRYTLNIFLNFKSVF